MNRGGVAFVRRFDATAGLQPTVGVLVATKTAQMVSPAYFTAAAISQSPKSFTASLTESFMATATPTTQTYGFCPFYEPSYLVVGESNDTPVTPIDGPGGGSATGSNPVTGYDTNWGGIQIEMEALSTNMSFMIEVRHCMELKPFDGGAWNIFATQPPPKDRPAMDTVERIRNAAPIGGSFNGVVEQARIFGQYLMREATTRMMTPANAAMVGVLTNNLLRPRQAMLMAP